MCERLLLQYLNWIGHRTAKVLTTTSLRMPKSLQTTLGSNDLIRKSVFSWDCQWALGLSRFSGVAVHLHLVNFEVFMMMKMQLTWGTNSGRFQKATLAQDNRRYRGPIHKSHDENDHQDNEWPLGLSFLVLMAWRCVPNMRDIIVDRMSEMQVYFGVVCLLPHKLVYSETK